MKETAFRASEYQDAKLAYNMDFRKLMRENPGLVNLALNLIERAKAQYKPKNLKLGDIEAEWDNEELGWVIIKRNNQEVKQKEYLEIGGGSSGVFFMESTAVRDSQSDLAVSLLGRSNREIPYRNLTRLDESDYYKFDFRQKSYFVKNSRVTTNPGFSEFQNAQEAKKRLADIPNVTIVEGLLGYQDKKQSWYVAPYQELELAGFESVNCLELGGYNNYGVPAQTFDPEDTEKISQFKHQVQQIKNRLTLLDGDLKPNLFYNIKTGQFIIFDITTSLQNLKPDNMLGRPIRRSGTGLF